MKKIISLNVFWRFETWGRYFAHKIMLATKPLPISLGILTNIALQSGVATTERRSWRCKWWSQFQCLLWCVQTNGVCTFRIVESSVNGVVCWDMFQKFLMFIRLWKNMFSMTCCSCKSDYLHNLTLHFRWTSWIKRFHINWLAETALLFSQFFLLTLYHLMSSLGVH